jgi:hypothetical protein
VHVADEAARAACSSHHAGPEEFCSVPSSVDGFGTLRDQSAVSDCAIYGGTMLKRLSTFACGGRLFSVRGLLLLAALAGLTSPVAAEGTRTLHPSGATGNRGVMDSSDGTFFANVARGRQFLYVYAQAGEYILLGSRNRSNGGDVFVYDPQAFGMP